MPKPGQVTGRRKLVHIVTKYIRDRYPRVLENDDIAEALGLTHAQVRNCVRNYIARPDVHDIIEDGPYRYVAVSPNDVHLPHPVSGGPATHSLDGTILVNAGASDAPVFRFLLVVSDGEVLLQDQDKNVWKAVLL
jgi:hypothetical protein